jgi:hypothetical protein
MRRTIHTTQRDVETRHAFREDPRPAHLPGVESFATSWCLSLLPASSRAFLCHIASPLRIANPPQRSALGDYQARTMSVSSSSGSPATKRRGRPPKSVIGAAAASPTPSTKRTQPKASSQPQTYGTIETLAGPVTLSRHTEKWYRSRTVAHAYELCSGRSKHALEELRELLAVRGMEWLNQARTQPQPGVSMPWAHVHYAAMADTPDILRWLYENEATMNQLSYSEFKRVPPGSTALHVAVAHAKIDRSDERNRSSARQSRARCGECSQYSPQEP